MQNLNNYIKVESTLEEISLLESRLFQENNPCCLQRIAVELVALENTLTELELSNTL